MPKNTNPTPEELAAWAAADRNVINILAGVYRAQDAYEAWLDEQKPDDEEEEDEEDE